MLEEEKALEQEILTAEEPTTPEGGEEEKTTQEVTVQPKTSWKKRYTNYKASTDNTIHGLRQDVVGLKLQLSDKVEETLNLKDRLSKLEAETKVKETESIFTEEDEQLIGSDAINIIKKAIPKDSHLVDNSKYEQLEAQIQELRAEKTERLRREAEDLKTQSIDKLKDRLSSLVPDWKEIDKEESFKDFIDSIDPISGVKNLTFFVNAINDGDVTRVANFYNNYKALKPKSKEDILANKVTPSSGGSTGEGGSDIGIKKNYTIEEYVNFMDQLALGKFNGTHQEAKKQEKIFDLAFSEGRVV